MSQPKPLDPQKIEVFDLGQGCKDRCVAKKIDEDKMTEAEIETLMVSVLNEFIEAQNNADFRVSLIPHREPFEPTRFLCTKEKVASPQRAMILHPWDDNDLVALKPEDRATIVSMRLKQELKKLNGSRIVVDDMVIFHTFDESFLFVIVHDA